MTGDGVAEYLASTTANSWTPHVAMVSPNRTTVWTKIVPSLIHFDISALGDVDGDGFGDVAVCDGLSAGVFSGTNGQLIQGLGGGVTRVGGLGDVDGDGSPDLAVRATAGVEIRRAVDDSLIRAVPLAGGRVAASVRSWSARVTWTAMGFPT